MKKFFAAAVLLALVSCADKLPTDPTKVERSALPREWPKSDSLAAAWGGPSGPSRGMQGVPEMVYSDPNARGRYVRILYHGKEQPLTIRHYDGRLASDGKLSVLGRTVDFYGSGNEAAEISTQPILLTSPSGWTGWYVFSFSSKEHLGGKNLPVFSW